ncbi:MAG: thiamine phosphate synthase [Nitrospirae bacterium]|nr:MAG: thiamine phosphate synthase [Nitrospirota bacterium]
MDISGICFITDRTYCDLPVTDMVGIVLKAGIRFIQYRDKDRTRRELYEEAVKLREITRSFNAVLIINDHADIALAVGADGVHLGQDDLPLREARRLMGSRIIGISTHSLEQAREAGAGGADYIGFGPVFHTTTKDAGAPKGLDNIRLIKQNVSIPVVAIGGINPDNIVSVFDAGADAAAVATGICRGNMEENAGLFAHIMRNKYPKK